MNRSSAAILAALSLTCAAAGAEPAAWRVEGERGGEIVLLGSVHTLRDSDYPLPASVDALYERADALVMELDLDDLEPALIQTELLRAAMLPADTGLERVLDGSLYRAAADRAGTLGVDLGMLDRFEPWLVAITMLDLGMIELGYRPDRGIEQYLLGRARRDDKEIRGLETLENQVAVFDELPLAEQAALLEQTLNELDSAEDVMADMISAWRDGRLDALAVTLLADFEAFPSLYESLVVERNRAWIGTIEDLLDDGTGYLVVVGGLHLVGDDSVIDLLEARGHAVERIRH
jgi:uncharacterized protein YbaP (TraB family)